MKFKTIAIFIHGGHFNQEKSVIFRQFASVAGCVRSFMLQKNKDPLFLNLGQNSFSLLEQVKLFLISKTETSMILITSYLIGGDDAPDKVRGSQGQFIRAEKNNMLQGRSFWALNRCS